MLPVAQGLTTVIEQGINTALRLDMNGASRLQALYGQRFAVKLHELPWPLVFVFSERVDVLADAEASTDCRIELSLTTLPELRDPAELSRLIHEQKLVLDGNLRTAQLFSQLLTELDVDLEEHLSRYIGDVAAFRFMEGVSRAKNKAQSQWQSLQQLARDMALVEKPVAVHRIAVADFCDQVSELRADVDRFEARLARLEQGSSN